MKREACHLREDNEREDNVMEGNELEDEREAYYAY